MKLYVCETSIKRIVLFVVNLNSLKFLSNSELLKTCAIDLDIGENLEKF